MDVDWARAVTTLGDPRRIPFVRDVPEIRALPAADMPAQGSATGTDLARQLAGQSRAAQEQALIDLIRAEAAVVLGHASASAVEVLMEIARTAPGDVEAIGAIKGMPRGMVERAGRDVLDAVKRGHRRSRRAAAEISAFGAVGQGSGFRCQSRETQGCAR